jgi:hypothetical protein
VALRAEGAAAGQQLWVGSSRARGCGEELACLLAYRRALVKAVVVRWIVVFGAGSTKLLSMSGTAACWHVNCEVMHAQRSDDGPWGGGTVASSRLELSTEARQDSGCSINV